MITLAAEFERHGCAVVPSVVSDEQVTRVAGYCDAVELSGAGSRDLLEHTWCADIARAMRSIEPLRKLLGRSQTAVQCTLFVKDAERNWLVPLHRDYSIPVKARIASPLWSAWSVKQSIQFGRPPQPV